MSLDKALYKALRTGLGDKAAKLLADRESQYTLKAYDEHNGPYQELWAIVPNLGPVIDTYVSPGTSNFEADNKQALPLTAGTYVELKYEQWLPPSEDYYQDGSMTLHLTKVADANGIPVTPAHTGFTAARFGGSVGLPGNQSGYTISASGSPSSGFRATVTSAGWYLIRAQATRF